MTPITLNHGEVKAISLTALLPDPDQPRKTFNEKSLSEMAYSLKTAGQLQPVVVRTNGVAGKFFIVHGERRFRGATLAELKTLDCILEHRIDKNEDNILPGSAWSAK